MARACREEGWKGKDIDDVRGFLKLKGTTLLELWEKIQAERVDK